MFRCPVSVTNGKYAIAKVYLSTIHFYIILKLLADFIYENKGLSTIHFYIILKLRKPSSGTKRKFEHHTFLHHSQTDQSDQIYLLSFEHHTFLHHSQTMEDIESTFNKFEHHTFLHHSQTDHAKSDAVILFEHHTFLHHSQTQSCNIM